MDAIAAAADPVHRVQVLDRASGQLLFEWTLPQSTGSGVGLAAVLQSARLLSSELGAGEVRRLTFEPSGGGGGGAMEAVLAVHGGVLVAVYYRDVVAAGGGAEALALAAAAGAAPLPWATQASQASSQVAMDALLQPLLARYA